MKTPSRLEILTATATAIAELRKQSDLLEHGDLLFVYGTLKKGYCNHHLLEGAPSLGKATTLQPLIMPKGGTIPFVYPTPMGHKIRGEVYCPGTLMWKRLDRLEGHPDNYRRAKIKVRTISDDTVRLAWCYFFTYPVERFFAPSSWTDGWDNPRMKAIRTNHK